MVHTQNVEISAWEINACPEYVNIFDLGKGIVKLLGMRAHEGGRVEIGNRQWYDRAIRDLDEAIRLDPRFAQAFLNRGLLLLSPGDNARAQQDLLHALELDPKIEDRLTPQIRVFLHEKE
jgi:tetratricopeptide (TPR) repeat protein